MMPYVSGASVQGRDHRADGRENQDAFHAATADDGHTLVLAVSDGAGSRPRSALGSHIAVDVACRILTSDPPGANASADAWQSWLSARRRSVVDECRHAVAGLAGSAATEAERSATAYAMAATLAAAVICPPWTCFLSVGDCFGAILTKGTPERCFLVLPPDSFGEVTVFLSSPSALARMRTFVVWEPELSGVMLATDGCQALALDHPAHLGLSLSAGPQPAAGFFVGLAGAVREGAGDSEAIHRLLADQADRCTDDLTVLCALAEAG
jgi:Protein phosphatase 2C